MAKFGITKNNDDQTFNVTFSEPQFHDFIQGLASSPREEVHDIKVGYDLSKSDLKNIVDKFIYQARTQNNLVSDTYTFTCTLSDDREVTWHSYEQFFNTVETFKEDPIKITASITLMVAFNREGGQKVERQVVSLEFFTVPLGAVTIRVMSTEITWPPTVIQLIKNEIVSISIDKQEKSDVPWVMRWLVATMFNAKLMRHFEKSVGRRFGSMTAHAERMTTMIFASLMIMLPSMLIALASFKEQVPMLNAETGFLERNTFSDFVARDGLEAALKNARDSEILYATGYATWGDSHGPLHYLGGEILKLTSFWAALFFICVTVFFYLCRRKSKELFQNRESRIFINDGPMPPRAPIKYQSGLIESLLVGLMAASIWSIVERFIFTLS